MKLLFILHRLDPVAVNDCQTVAKYYFSVNISELHIHSGFISGTTTDIGNRYPYFSYKLKKLG